MLRYRTPFYDALTQKITDLGGIFNAHLHLDRAGTIEEKYMRASGVQHQEASSISLAQKHGIISILHNGPAYDTDDLSRRVTAYVEMMIAAGTSRADTVVDVSCDRVGLSALKTLSELKQHYAQDIDLRLGAYSPLGFTDTEPERWQLLTAAAEIADFIGSLPERDDQTDYPDHIGFYENCRRVLALAFILSNAIRFYDVDILAKLAAGKRLDDADKTLIQQHLQANDLEVQKVLNKSRLPLDSIVSGSEDRSQDTLLATDL